MAITTAQRTDIVKLAVSMFSAAPGGYLTELTDTYTAAGNNITTLANSLAANPLFQASYPTYLSNEEIATRMIASYGLTNSAGIGAEAYTYVLGHLTAGVSIGSIFVAANDFMMTTTDTAWATPHNLYVNKVNLANYFSVDMASTSKTMATLQSVLSEVTASTNTTSATAMQTFIDATAAGMTYTALATTQDNLVGTAGNDSFKAYIVDNTNTFQSGDIVNGVAGTDRLTIELGTSQAFAITAKTQSVENIFVRNQSVDAEDASSNGTNSTTANGYSSNDADDSAIDAQDMIGVRQYWSVDSRGDLQIEDVRQNSHETTIGLRSTDAGDVDFEVYFDHATAPGAATSGSALYLRILDLQSMQTNATPLGTNPYNGVTFNMGSTLVKAQAAAAFTSTFAAMVAELNASFVSQGLSNLTASLGSTYTAIKADTGVSYTGTEIVITNSGSAVLATGGWTTPTGTLPGTNNMYTTQSITPPTTTTPLTSVEIVLDNVGRGSQSGDLVVGLITDDNVDANAQQVGEGIQKFNVQVDRNSWISDLTSTENVLQEVNLTNTGANGSVRIDQLTDVKTFNGSAMSGAVNVTAVLSSNVVAKYMELSDTADNAAADLDAFNYTTGTGNDSVSMTISSANLEAAGTTTREDFSLNITSGAGDDTVTTQIATVANLANGFNFGAITNNGLATGAENWYQNSKINANLAINTGDGADTINNFGGGDFAINAGTGNDVVYVDNSGVQDGLVATVATGDRATWIVNSSTQSLAAGTAGEELGNLLSSTNATHNLYKATVTVRFKGLESAATVIASTNYKSSDLQINQAIKSAIANSATLSKLIVAKDGPSNTLVITSLIDGLMVDGDTGIDGLGISFANPTTALTAAEITAVSTAWDPATPANFDTAGEITAGGTAAINAITGTDGDAYRAVFAETDGVAANITGVDSANVNDSTITDGTGNDLYVLSTDVTGGTALTTSTNTVVFNTVGFGDDTIVNFTVAALTAGGDTLNLRAFVDNTVTAGAMIATTLTNSYTAAATPVAGDINAAGTTFAANKIIIDDIYNDGTAASIANENHNATEVKNLFMANNADGGDAAGTITTLYIAVTASNVGTVYQVVDATTAALEATDITVTALGTIDLADTGWNTMVLANLA